MPKVSDEELMQEALLQEVKAIEGTNAEKKDGTPDPEAPKVVEAPRSSAAQYLGQKLTHVPGENPFKETSTSTTDMVEKKGLTRIGETIGQTADYREGWIDVPRELLGERAIFYPEDWNFRIKPASVEAIRSWSTLDDGNANSIDDVFTEVLKACVSIVGPHGPIPVVNICSWDRFFFLLLVREYTFTKGESKLEYQEDCIECDNPVTFELKSYALRYEMPDPEVMPNYDQATRCWTIDPEEYDVEGYPVVKLYVPTVEKDTNIKQWVISRLQNNANRKVDSNFLRFLMWMAPKISKDATIAQRQIRDYEVAYKSWSIDMFSFMDEVLRNIMVEPSSKLEAQCPTCGESMTSDIRFPNGIRDLFNIQSRSKKFGKK